uniref:Secreted protein n=1 Tax=Myotis myotis TaxID=51298 RepID=A0A7J7WVS0_MYOMY|nr:hypothetical protein mMyoMyo1_011893 [Myotis myotis]
MGLDSLELVLCSAATLTMSLVSAVSAIRGDPCSAGKPFWETCSPFEVSHCCWDSVSSETFVLGSGEGGRLFLSSSSCCLRTSSSSNVVSLSRAENLSSQVAADFSKASWRLMSFSTSSTLWPISRLDRYGSCPSSQASATLASLEN